MSFSVRSQGIPDSLLTTAEETFRAKPSPVSLSLQQEVQIQADRDRRNSDQNGVYRSDRPGFRPSNTECEPEDPRPAGGESKPAPRKNRRQEKQHVDDLHAVV